jgi:hypothetical protein
MARDDHACGHHGDSRAAHRKSHKRRARVMLSEFTPVHLPCLVTTVALAVAVNALMRCPDGGKLKLPAITAITRALAAFTALN